ncbi:hypothetical protein DID73_02430 [Candidatus Marinamargulisbacteria bacterium SCGC AG-343-K17]|nr:hypothetical protein DID73_02430 [Candidatus Marinamargulisbacteria bacterium SCGC AG-343-K17]
MTTQQQDRTILPLDMTSIIGLLQPTGGGFAPLHYDITQPSPETTEIHVNIQQCNPESIAINVTPHSVSISADASFTFQESQEKDGIDLKRHVDTHIPMAPGVDVSGIRSQLTDDTLILTIPMA